MGNSRTVKKYPFLIYGNTNASDAMNYVTMLREYGLDIVVEREDGRHFIYGHDRVDSVVGRAMIAGYERGRSSYMSIMDRILDKITLDSK